MDKNDELSELAARHQVPVRRHGKHERLRQCPRDAFWEVIISLIACLLAAAPLMDFRRNFGTDWFNHLWMIEYSGQHVLHSHSALDVLNTPQLVGSPDPLFYASKFYTILGIASARLGSGIAFRVFALLTFLLQYWHVRRAAGIFNPPRWAGCVPAVAVTWAIYPLVNLYERCDLTEFTAFNFLTCAISTLFVLLVRIGRGECDRYGWLATGLFYGFVAMANPLAGMYGAIFVAILGLVGLSTLRRRSVIWFGLVTFLSVGLQLSPWLYVVVKFGRHLQISNPGGNAGLFQISYESTPWEALLSTLNPVSVGPAFVRRDLKTEALNIPLSIALLVFAVGLAALWRRCPRRSNPDQALLAALLAVSYVTFGLTLLVYCSPGCSALLGRAFDIMQYPYRLINYVNASLLVCTLCLFGLVDWNRLRHQSFSYAVLKLTVITGCLLATGSLGCKLSFLQSAIRIAALERSIEKDFRFQTGTSKVDHWRPRLFRVDKTLVAQLPATWYAEGAYAVDSGYSAIVQGSTRLGSINGAFTVDSESGAVRALELEVLDATEVTTNVSPFPWNIVYLDGEPIEARNMVVVADVFKVPGVNPEFLRFRVPPGRHRLNYAFIPDKPWQILKDISWTVMFVWIGAWLFVSTESVCLRLRHQWVSSPG